MDHSTAALDCLYGCNDFEFEVLVFPKCLSRQALAFTESQARQTARLGYRRCRVVSTQCLTAGALTVQLL